MKPAHSSTILILSLVFLGVRPFALPASGAEAATTPRFLSEMQEFDVKAGPWGFGKGSKKGSEKVPIIIRGITSAHGLGMHPPSSGVSSVKYHLDRGYTTFVAGAVIGWNSRGARVYSPLTFTVLGDGKVLWESQPMQRVEQVQPCKLDVRGVGILELRVVCRGINENAHACWLEPHLLSDTAVKVAAGRPKKPEVQAIPPSPLAKNDATPPSTENANNRVPAIAQEAAKKSPVPAATAQAEATKLIKEVYGDEWAAAKTPAQKSALAKKLLEKAGELNDDPAGQFVLLRLARDIATQANDGQTAFSAIDSMAETFQVNALEMKVVVLTNLSSATQLTARHKSIAEEALKLVDQAVAQDNFTVADELGKLALDEARKAREKELIAQAQGRNNEVSELAKVYEDVSAARITLVKTPDDPEANLVVGKYLCFARGDWDKGLPMLALGKDDALKALAKQEREGAASSKEQAKLGDGWWELAEKQDGTVKKQMQARAGHWYQEALPGLSGLTKAKVEKRVGLSTGILPKQENPHNLPQVSVIDVNKHSVLFSPAGVWKKYDLNSQATLRLESNGTGTFIYPGHKSGCSWRVDKGVFVLHFADFGKRTCSILDGDTFMETQNKWLRVR